MCDRTPEVQESAPGDIVMVTINDKQLATITRLSRGYGVRLDVYESEEGDEIVVHVLHKIGYEVVFVRSDGSLVGPDKDAARQPTHDLPREQIHWACSGCGREANWSGGRSFCGACGSREREAWLFAPIRSDAADHNDRSAA